MHIRLADPSPGGPGERSGLDRVRRTGRAGVRGAAGPRFGGDGRLRTRLAEQAQREGVLDVAYRTVDTQVGGLLPAATEHGPVRVAFAVQDHDAVLRTLADRVSPRILSASHRPDEASRQLEE